MPAKLVMTFMRGNKECAAEIDQLARKIGPDEVQLVTPIRPQIANPLSEHEMREIPKKFTGLAVRCVYDRVRR